MGISVGLVTGFSRTAQSTADHLGPICTVLANADLRQGSFLHAGQNVQSRHQESHAEHRLSRETALRSRSTQSNRGRAKVRTGLHPQPWNDSYIFIVEDLLKTEDHR